MTDRIHHTEQMDRDLAENFLDFVQRKQTEADAIASHRRLYDPEHHHKLGTYWSAARGAYTALFNGMRLYDPAAFSKWKPSRQLFDVMKKEMLLRKLLRP